MNVRGWRVFKHTLFSPSHAVSLMIMDSGRITTGGSKLWQTSWMRGYECLWVGLHVWTGIRDRFKERDLNDEAVFLNPSLFLLVHVWRVRCKHTWAQPLILQPSHCNSVGFMIQWAEPIKRKHEWLFMKDQVETEKAESDVTMKMSLGPIIE